MPTTHTTQLPPSTHRVRPSSELTLPAPLRGPRPAAPAPKPLVPPVTDPLTPPLAVRCGPRDGAVVGPRLAHDPLKREVPGCADFRHLDSPIDKPWGGEYRIYADVLLDVWLLTLLAGTETSTHCHTRKDTVLLCLRGEAELNTVDEDRRLAIRPGSIVHIEQGAVHRTRAWSDVVLVEVETPRDKLNVLRIDDAGGRELKPYEDAASVTRELDPPLSDVADGPARARLRPRCETGEFAFALERGGDLRGRRRHPMFSIDLDAMSILRRELRVAGPQTLHTPGDDRMFLTIRRRGEQG